MLLGANEFDVVILGGGTGGYVAAIRASQLGMKVAVVEKEKLGGTCLHKGCIPSKALLRSAEVYHTVKESQKFGVDVAEVSINFLNMQERKQAIINQLYSGVQHLMRKGNISIYQGEGRIMGPSIFSPLAGSVAVTHLDGTSEILVPKNLVIATGSKPRGLAGLLVDEQDVMTSDGALSMQSLPKSILIIGGGVIGVEWASMLNDFGVKVQIVEFAERLLPQEDVEISTEMTRLLKKRNIEILTGTKVLPETFVKEKEGKLSILAKQGETVLSLEAEKILVSVGREANIANIGIDNTEIAIENGVIEVNEYFQTAESNIYAIGDVIGGLQLAHAATAEGITAVEHMAGLHPNPVSYNHVPKVTYSRPEIASIGMTEEQAKQMGFPVKIGKFSFKAIGKALIYGESDGFVKLVVDEQTDDVLGIHMIGPHVSELIAEGALAKTLDATPWEIAKTIHPHPSLSEVLGEAGLSVDKIAIHT